MAKAEMPVSWKTVGEHLLRWHECGDRDALRAALLFIEPQLRLMVPALVWRTWPADLIEDALRTFLLRLVEVPLPSGMESPRGYLTRALRNHCIDKHNTRVRRRESSIEDAPTGWEPAAEEQASPAENLNRQQRAKQLHAALGKLEIADRVVLKLAYGREWLDDDEISWLGERLVMGAASVRRTVAVAEDTHALTRIFDPSDDDPADPATRRLRMERFRRRKARARDKLGALLQEVK